MPPATTQAAARDHLLRHFTETLRLLPAGLELVLDHPDLPKARFGRGITVSVNEHDLADVDDPAVILEVFSIRYWVLGTTPETSDRVFDLVLRAWEQQGWPTRTEGRSGLRSGDTRTPDGYWLGVTQSVNGYLSVAGGTPTFPRGSAEGSPLPTRIGGPGLK